uniref:Hox9 N-terminal activation domain-containing protein n=1 Tax=Spermophilus dauricus TaxID=99837 RepID=A0A8C9UUI9_SPEDA
MSATGPISNYYVDSLISHDNEDLLASRFPATGCCPASFLHLPPPASTPLWGSCAQLNPGGPGTLPGVGVAEVLGWKGAPLTLACVWPSRQPRGQLDPRPFHEEEALPLHQVPDAGTGEGVSLQYVFNQGPSVRGGPGSQSH